MGNTLHLVLRTFKWRHNLTSEHKHHTDDWGTTDVRHQDERALAGRTVSESHRAARSLLSNRQPMQVSARLCKRGGLGWPISVCLSGLCVATYNYCKLESLVHVVYCPSILPLLTWLIIPCYTSYCRLTMCRIFVVVIQSNFCRVSLQYFWYVNFTQSECWLLVRAVTSSFYLDLVSAI